MTFALNMFSTLKVERQTFQTAWKLTKGVLIHQDNAPFSQVCGLIWYDLVYFCIFPQ